MSKWEDNISDSIRRTIELESALTPEQLRRMGEQLDKHGVTAPDVKDN